MGLVKLLQASDVHDETVGHKRFNALVNLAKQERVDGILLIGDFFDKQDVALTQFLRKQNAPKAKEHFAKYTSKERETLQIGYAIFQELGGLARAKNLAISPEVTEESRK